MGFARFVDLNTHFRGEEMKNKDRNYVAKHFNKFCKPAVLTDEKKETKLRPKKYKHSEEEE